MDTPENDIPLTNENPRKLSENILDSFKKITYNLEKFRIEGATSLLKYLSSKQKDSVSI